MIEPVGDRARKLEREAIVSKMAKFEKQLRERGAVREANAVDVCMQGIKRGDRNQ